MIYDKYKCIHIHIPKTAGTSITKALHGKDFVLFDTNKKIWRQHATALETREHYGKEKWDSYFKFSIVRNPFDRLVSAYNWLCQDMKPCEFRDRMLFKSFIFRKGIFEKM